MKKLISAVAIVLTIGLVLLVTPDLHAQYYSALGIRVGGTSGVTAKYFYKPATAVEGIVGTFGNGYSVTGLLERYVPVYDTKGDTKTGLYLYYGGGLHLSVYNGRNNDSEYFGREIDYHKNNDVGLGINGIFGVEYRLPENIPLAFSLDLKPFIEIGTGGRISAAPDPSIGIKFIFR